MVDVELDPPLATELDEVVIVKLRESRVDVDTSGKLDEIELPRLEGTPGDEEGRRLLDDEPDVEEDEGDRGRELEGGTLGEAVVEELGETTVDEEGRRLLERVLLAVLLVGGAESDDVGMLSTGFNDPLAIGRAVELEASNGAELDSEDAGFDDSLRVGRPIELDTSESIKLDVEIVELDEV